MIKKLNILLLSLVLAMLVAKFAVDRLSAVRGGSAAPRTASSVLNAGFAPRIVYRELVSIAMVNPMTQRNGCVLDVMKAIFPNGTLDERKLDVASTSDLLKRDPHAVCVTYGDHPLLRDFPHAPTPIAEAEIVLYTPRTLEWSYDGPASLSKIKIGFVEGYEDCPNLLRLYEASLKTDNPMILFRHSDKYYRDPLSAVLDGVVDAVALLRTDYSSETIGVTVKTLFKFNVSPAIDKVPFLLTVSKADPEYAQALIAAYESGYKVLEDSGALRRIREYYRIGSK